MDSQENKINQQKSELLNKIEEINNELKQLEEPIKPAEVQSEIVNDYKKFEQEKVKNLELIKVQAEQIAKLEEINSKNKLIQDTIEKSTPKLEDKLIPKKQVSNEKFVYDKSITDLSAIRERMNKLQETIDSGNFKPKNIFSASLKNINKK